MNSKKILALLFAVVLLLGSLAGCGSRAEETNASLSSEAVPPISSGDTEGSGKTVKDSLPDYAEEIAERLEQNEDTMGWLLVPNTSIDDVVVCNFESNQYYERRNFEKENEFNGVYYADRRSFFGDGSAEQIGTNTCIYGHAMADNAEDEKYSIKFGPLHDFRDPEFAKEVPYIYFATQKETLAYEVCAVFIANADNPENPYNSNDMEPAEYNKLVKEQLLPRSLYNYDVALGEDEKFLVLSTCIYKLPDGTVLTYPNNYRFAILARLVSPDEPLKEEAVFTVNEDMLVDPAGKMSA